MGIFGKNKSETPVMASPPEEPETKAEEMYTQNVSAPAPQQPVQSEVQTPQIQEKVQPVSEYKEIPVCMSQEQINNIVIENNMMLKYIVSKIEE